jgi:hypothetical protein
LSIQIGPKASHHRTPSSAHTYRLFVVKELGSCPKQPAQISLPCHFVAAVKSFCLSAAEKRDYEALLFIRQLLFAEFFQLASFALPPRQRRPTCQSRMP